MEKIMAFISVVKSYFCIVKLFATVSFINGSLGFYTMVLFGGPQKSKNLISWAVLFSSEATL